MNVFSSKLGLQRKLSKYVFSPPIKYLHHTAYVIQLSCGAAVCVALRAHLAVGALLRSGYGIFNL